MYQKEIIYLGLFHNDVKERNAGYLKVDKREDVYRLELQVKNLPGAVTGSFPVRLQSETGWREADALVIKDGNGKWSQSMAEPVLRAEIIVSNVKRIKGESRFIEAESINAEPAESLFGQPEKQKEEADIPEQNAVRPARKREKTAVPEQSAVPAVEKREETGMPEIRDVPPTQRQEETIAQERKLKAPIWEGVPAAENRLPHKAFIRAERSPARKEHTPLYENKWEQLLTTYEQIHPYGDNRIYIKLEPKDFIVLRENYQHLVNNSFLLHGFYNYRYLILGREKDFYLGVPGVFYEREKMVALMFGFEAFECEGGEAEEGKFGYYLRKVEL